MPTVKEDDTPFAQEVVGEDDFLSANLAHFQAREHISGVEKLVVRFWHFDFLLPLQASHHTRSHSMIGEAHLYRLVTKVPISQGKRLSIIPECN